MKGNSVFRTLRNRLVCVCTLTTYGVLTIALLFVWVNAEKQWNVSQELSFKDNFKAASELVRSTIVVNHTKLAETEMKSRAALYMEDNGTPLVYCQDLHGESKRTVLFKQLRERALKDGINTGVRPVTLKEVTSKVYKLEGPGKERYWGSVFISAKGDKHRSLMMLQAAWDTEGILQKQRILYLVLNIIGGAVLFFISYGVVRKALKPVEENQKRQREFVAAASHELRSPLAVARANAAAITILCKEESLRELHSCKRDFDRSMVIKMEINKFSEGIQSECERMGGLVEDMLLLASADASAWNIKKDMVDMDTLVIELYDSYEVYCRERGMKLSLELGEEILPAVLGDRERIRQILSIFIHNAVSYSKEGDCIILRCYEKKHRLIVEVEDHGVGISDENKEKVFERFYRNDTARKDKNHFGLGLSIAKELTLQNGGAIKLSDTPGGGCTFAVLFSIANL